MSALEEYGLYFVAVRFGKVAALIFSAAAHAAVRPFTGRASYYGRAHQGHRMANGQRFDLHKLTAACLRIPLGAWARVTDLKTHKSVKVQITDRGPFGKGRVIDLSESAARALGLIRRGTGVVKIEVIK